MLTTEEKNFLLRTARVAARRALGLSVAHSPETPVRLREPGAAFVTWKKEGRLRGCIGSVAAHRPLILDVEEHAVDALVRDPRFAPARAADLERLSLEISVLGALVEVAEPPASIEIGRHGLLVAKGALSGLLLPQVALEWHWDAAKFLEQSCLKAGLPGDAWREGSPRATVYRFEAEVFGEEGPSLVSA